MSKLSPAFKQVLLRGGDPAPGPSAAALHRLFSRCEETSRKHSLPANHWVALTSASFYTLNTPGSLVHLYKYFDGQFEERARKAACMREVGLKCISFIGIAKIINELGVLSAAFDPEVNEVLSKEASRSVKPDNLPTVRDSGFDLWKSIYAPHDTKLINKLESYHPDLPVHILESHYGPLLSNPARQGAVDRVGTSLVAIACLRAQGGVGPQVISHVLGLKKAGEEAGWLGTDEGSEWTVGVVDEIIEMTKASEGLKAKL